MLRRLFAFAEPFILALLSTVLLATLLPVRGGAAAIFDIITDIGIALLFFLHGAKLSRQAIIDGARNLPLHLTVLATTFILFPLLGLALTHLPMLPPELAAGMLFLTLLPSTVQSSIAFTAIARGNVAAAVCSASFSNLIGIVATPALVALLMNRTGSAAPLSFASVQSILLQLLLPFVVGHMMHGRIGGFVHRHKKWVTLVDRGSILLVVYTAFSAAVVEGLWHAVSGEMLALLILLCCLLLVIVMTATQALGKMMGFDQEDAIVLLFCGSKKSLASGVPMAGILFPVAQVGGIILPLIFFHQIQLIACAIIARRFEHGAQPARA
ncbi:MAG: bile acid:sodium symporter [Sphingobium yanoikuyae]|uniref:bile acid:sodium symporter family protein n=1 Tax=Sphingobium yanoikuyae TaxID=13690 RepID=UPI001B09B275|nr:bile acid:sodium symporter [Sphingobium yanoikuyae]